MAKKKVKKKSPKKISSTKIKNSLKFCENFETSPDTTDVPTLPEGRVSLYSDSQTPAANFPSFNLTEAEAAAKNIQGRSIEGLDLNILAKALTDAASLTGDEPAVAPILPPGPDITFEEKVERTIARIGLRIEELEIDRSLLKAKALVVTQELEDQRLKNHNLASQVNAMRLAQVERHSRTLAEIVQSFFKALFTKPVWKRRN